MNIQKHCVIGTLYWLIANNLLYKNIGINHQLFETWDDKFIFSDIIDTMVYCNSNQHKREGYATEFYDDNFENDLDTGIASVKIERDYINSGCIYNDIDNGRQNSTL